MIFAIYIYKKMKGRDTDPGQRNIFLGYSLFLATYGLVRFFFIYSDIEIFYHGETALNDIYVGLAYTCGVLGALWLFYSIERYLVHSRYVFTILGMITLGIAIISLLQVIPTQIPRMIIFVAVPVFFGVIGLLYLYVAIKASGELRRRALGILTGLLVIMVGFLFGSSIFGNILDPAGLYVFRILTEPFLVMIGSAIFTFAQR